MPINDSAGVGVYLIDKSQRATTTVGFRSAAAIEADRGLCETPTLISSAKDYVNVFGTPKMDKHGKGSLEAFMLAQNNVPQVLTRVKNPMMDPLAKPFGLMAFELTGSDPDRALSLTAIAASGIAAPDTGDKCNIFAKGEGDYFAKSDRPNVVLRFSKPATYSAYCTPERVLKLDVFDFDGARHIDEDTEGEFQVSKDLSGMVNASGDFHATINGTDYTFGATGSTVVSNTDKVNLTVFVNGRTKSVEIPLADLHADTMGFGLWNQIAKTVRETTLANGELIIPSDSNEPFTYDGEKYVLNSRGTNLPQRVNCFTLSVSFSVEATLKFNVAGDVKSGFFSFPGGSVTINGTAKTAKFVINSSMFLANKGEYMFMGEQNSYWATYYNTYLKESFVFSFSYDDYDANYNSIQADAILAASNYLVSKSSENFGNYSVDESSDLVKNLQYFAQEIASNEITVAGAKSNAYATALTGLLTDNLTRWRCLVAPNLGDVIKSGDYTQAIQGANEVTLGLSNLGQAASVDFLATKGEGRHGNRFISDFSQYVYRTLNGKRTAVTAASLVAILLNQHYNDGIEARPPFGYTYGQIAGLGLSQVFTGPDRAKVARVYKVNPIIEDGGLYLWDERTSQLTETSLSDTHSIISFLWMKFALYDAMKSFVAEYNDQSTVNRGLSVLRSLHAYFVSRNYIEADSADLAVTAENNVLGSEVLRFDFRVRFKGVARYVDIFVTAYSQTQTLEVSLGQEA